MYKLFLSLWFSEKCPFSGKNVSVQKHKTGDIMELLEATAEPGANLRFSFKEIINPELFTVVG